MHDHPFIKTEEGLYELSAPASPDDIVSVAAGILYAELTQREALTAPEDAGRFLQLELAREKNEHFSVLFLDNKHRVLAFERMFHGTIDGSAIHPRVVAQRALEHNAAAVILAHNHPSDCCEPSEADRSITRRLVDALALIDVRVLDHLVVSRSEWVSLAERGWV